MSAHCNHGSIWLFLTETLLSSTSLNPDVYKFAASTQVGLKHFKWAYKIAFKEAIISFLLE